MNKKVLLIDDDHEIGELVEMILDSAEFKVFHAYSGLEGLRKTYDVRPDLVILDIMMPDMDGFDVCARLREMVNIPILMITALTSEKDMLRGFHVGVDDFLKKPFSAGELRARVFALLRRTKKLSPKEDSSPITGYLDPNMEVDLTMQMVKISGKKVELSPTEFNMLSFLIREQGRVISHHELVREVWGDSYADSKSMAALYIHYLRKKLRDGKLGHQYIRTFWGRGYWFAPIKEGGE